MNIWSNDCVLISSNFFTLQCPEKRLAVPQRDQLTHSISVNNFEFYTNNWLKIFASNTFVHSMRHRQINYVSIASANVRICDQIKTKTKNKGKNERKSLFVNIRTKNCIERCTLHRWSCAKCTQIQYCFAIYLMLCIFVFSCMFRIYRRKSGRAHAQRENLCVDSYCCRTQQDIHRTDYKIMCVRILLLLLYTLLSFKCSKSDLICTICMWISRTDTHTAGNPCKTISRITIIVAAAAAVVRSARSNQYCCKY